MVVMDPSDPTVIPKSQTQPVIIVLDEKTYLKFLRPNSKQRKTFAQL